MEELCDKLYLAHNELSSVNWKLENYKFHQEMNWKSIRWEIRWNVEKQQEQLISKLISAH